uniref:Small integral membrane protein 32 n=1 Tax=Steinernema glaseri TaxID=37863 RepID=A0A1I8A426_9BILA
MLFYSPDIAQGENHETAFMFLLVILMSLFTSVLLVLACLCVFLRGPVTSRSFLDTPSERRLLIEKCAHGGPDYV